MEWRVFIYNNPDIESIEIMFVRRGGYGIAGTDCQFNLARWKLRRKQISPGGELQELSVQISPIMNCTAGINSKSTSKFLCLYMNRKQRHMYSKIISE